MYTSNYGEMALILGKSFMLNNGICGILHKCAALLEMRLGEFIMNSIYRYFSIHRHI